MQDTTERRDVYGRITAQIVEQLEKGTRPWIRPWNAEHAARRITRPLRHNGQPYSGINVLSLCESAPCRRRKKRPPDVHLQTVYLNSAGQASPSAFVSYPIVLKELRSLFRRSNSVSRRKVSCKVFDKASERA